MSHNYNDKPPDTLKTKNKLDNAVISGKSPETIAKVLVEFAADMTQRYSSKLNGTTVGPLDHVNGVWWVIYQDDEYEIRSIALMLISSLELFAKEPWTCIPEESRLSTVVIFGLFNAFETEVAPHVANLMKCGLENIFYYGWDTQNGNYVRYDARNRLKKMLAKFKNRESINEHKKNLIKKNSGVLDIKELANIRGLRKLIKQIKSSE